MYVINSKYYTSNSKCLIKKLSLCHVNMKFINESRLTSSYPSDVASDFNLITRNVFDHITIYDCSLRIVRAGEERVRRLYHTG